MDQIIAMAQEIATVEVPREWRWITIPLRIEVAKSAVDGNWAEMQTVH